MVQDPHPFTDCPPPPESDSPEDLGFTRQGMVSWFTPAELARAGVKALLSGLFGAYADNREVQAALVGENVFDYSDEQDVWIDYVGDLGDGWDSTYAVARLLAQRRLDLPVGPEGAGERPRHATERGRLLVLGGDQVYPTATNEEYQNRMVGPYRCALPYVHEAQDRPPHLFAIPGNHDWYDGLTSFRRLFTQGRWIGGWQTRQTRSYFAIKLAHGWWLWGIDVQLGSDIDQPQLDYFAQLAHDTLEPGSKIILCCAEPSWVYSVTKGPEAYQNLGYFEKNVIQRHGHRLVVGLSGDLHTYARYQDSASSQQRFIAGGGGAYLYPSHDLPENLQLPSKDETVTDYPSKKVFPEVGNSRKLALGSLRFPFLNPKFSLFLGAFYLWYAWVVQSVSKMKEGITFRMGDGGVLERIPSGDTFLEDLARHAPGIGYLPEAYQRFWEILAHSPGSCMVLLALVAGLVGFADGKTVPKKLALGLPHAAAHLLLHFYMMWTLAYVNLSVLGLGLDSLPQVALFGVGMYVLGGILGGCLMGLYLFLANWLFRVHSNEVFLCQSLPDYKNCLRLHLGADGGLTIYPIGIRKVPKSWQVQSGAAPGQPWFEPATGQIADYAELIEEPVVIRAADA